MREQFLHVFGIRKSDPFILVFVIDKNGNFERTVRTTVTFDITGKTHHFRRYNFTDRIIRQVTKQDSVVLRHYFFMYKTSTYFFIAVSKSDNHSRRLFIFVIHFHKLHFAVT